MRRHASHRPRRHRILFWIKVCQWCVDQHWPCLAVRERDYLSQIEATPAPGTGTDRLYQGRARVTR